MRLGGRCVPELKKRKEKKKVYHGKIFQNIALSKETVAGALMFQSSVTGKEESDLS